MIKPVSSPFDVRYTAQLARLNLTEEEIAKFQSQLSQVLDYVEKLRLVDVTGVEPTAHTNPVFNVFREDIVEPSLTVEQVLQNAPESDGPFFKVPKVIGGEEDSAG